MRDHVDLSKIVPFTFVDAPNDSAGRLGRKLVLFRIMRALGKRFEDPLKAGDRVLKWWRAKVRKLGRADESLAVEDAVLEGRPLPPPFGIYRSWNEEMAHSNCFPTSLRVAEAGTVTCRSDHCPWCYTRKLQYLIRSAGLEPVKDFLERCRGRKVVSAETVITIPESGAAIADPEERLAHAVGLAGSGCRSIVRVNRDRVDGLHWSVVVEPRQSSRRFPAGCDRGWLVRARVLAVMPESSFVEFFPDCWSVDINPLSAATFGKALKVLGYPIGFVTASAELSLLAVRAARPAPPEVGRGYRRPLSGVVGVFRRGGKDSWFRDVKPADADIADVDDGPQTLRFPDEQAG